MRSRFVLQLISLAGLHSTAVVTAELAQQYKQNGMTAYVNLIQRKEKEIGCDVLTHQKWSVEHAYNRIMLMICIGAVPTTWIESYRVSQALARFALRLLT